MADSNKQLARLVSSANLEKLDPERPDLDRAYKALAGKLPDYNDIWEYYDGDQPLMYTAKRMLDLFESLDMATFVENWCAVVIDAANDRIRLSGITIEGQDSDALSDIWEELDMGLEASDAHEAALVIGESYLLVWPEEEKQLDAYYNDPRLVHLFYDPSNPRKKWYGAKWWVDSDSFTRMTLYYPDKLEYYRTNKAGKDVASSKAFEPFSPDGTKGGMVAENPYGEVPVFHFRTERRKVKGDLVNVIPLQNAINKLVTDMMVAAEYGAFRQRWIVSNADTSSLKNAPNEIWEVPAGDGVGQQTSLGQFDATDLGNYIKSIDHLASACAIISRTPKHFLFQQGGDPSGEALIAMEAPLNKRCSDHIEKFAPVWKEIAQFMLKVLGKEEIARNDISVNYLKPETIQPKTEAEVRNLGKQAGIPLITLLREEGKDDAWLEQMGKDKEEETKANQQSLGAALLNSIRKSNEPEEGPPGTPSEEGAESAQPQG